MNAHVRYPASQQPLSVSSHCLAASMLAAIVWQPACWQPLSGCIMLFVVLVIISATLWAQPQGQRLPIDLWWAFCVGKMWLPARQFNCWVASDTWEHQMLWTYGGYSNTTASTSRPLVPGGGPGRGPDGQAIKRHWVWCQYSIGGYGCQLAGSHGGGDDSW